MEKELGAKKEMEELGQKRKPLVRKKEDETKKNPTFLTGMLTLILIVSYIFTLKNYEPVKNIVITGGIMVYPLSFLIIAYISKYYGFKTARRSIYTSSILYVMFIVLVMIAVMPHSNNITSDYNVVVQYIFVNNFLSIGESGFSFFYPTIGQFLSIVVSFVISHLLYATIYNALKGFTIDYLAVGLSLFIGYILDRLIYVPILYAKGLMNGANTFEYFIQILTSEFIGAIVMSVAIIIVFAIISAIKKTVEKK